MRVLLVMLLARRPGAHALSLKVSSVAHIADFNNHMIDESVVCLFSLGENYARAYLPFFSHVISLTACFSMFKTLMLLVWSMSPSGNFPVDHSM